MPSDERDLQFERALAKHLRNESDATCPDAEILAAYHERTLSSEEMTRWKSHIAACARCQQALSLLEETEKALAEGNNGEVDHNLVKELVATSPVRVSRALARGEVLESAPAQAMSAAAPSSANVIQLQQRKTTRRWTLPLATLAAALLLFVGVYETRVANRAKLATAEIAANRPVPAQNQAMSDNGSPIGPSPAPPANYSANLPAAPAPVSPPPVSPMEPALSRKASESPSAHKASGALDRSDDEKRVQQAMAQARARASLSNSIEDRVGAGGGAGSAAGQSAAQKQAVSALSTPSPSLKRPSVGGAGAKSKEEQAEGRAETPVGTPMGKSPVMPTEKKDMPQSVSQNVEVQSAAPVVTNSSASASVTTLDSSASTLNGRSLSQFSTVLPPNSVVVLAPNSKHAWRVGASGAIELTTNAGKNWKVQTSGVVDDLTSGSAASDKVCWLAGKAGTLLLTTDGGKRWRKITTPIQGDLGGVHAIDSQHAAIWDVPNRLNFETADGGATWKRAGNE
jgi:Photosynthesis system II assembly factor YCF48